MGYYDHAKAQRTTLYSIMEENILQDLNQNKKDHIFQYASDEDTYIRKNTYLILGRL